MLAAIQSHRYTEYALLILGILIPTLLIISKFEGIAPYILIGAPVAFLIIYFGTLFQGSFILLYLLCSITFLENEPGIQTIEIPFYALSILLALYLLVDIFRGNLILVTNFDKLFFLLLLLLPYGVLLGVLNGASLYKAFGELTYFFGALIYFPLRKHLSNQKFESVLKGIVLIIIAFVLIRNLINYRQLIIQAVLPWQAENARAAANEFVIMFGCCFFMSAAALATSKLKQLIYTSLFLLLIGGLILTQSRGYWLGFIFGAIAIFYVVHKKGKTRILVTFSILSLTTLFVSLVFFGDQFNIILNALTDRFQSIGSGKLDVSLQERYLESKTVFKMMLQNPVAGYGIGYEYTKKLLVHDYFIRASYVHNGYLAAWLKLGLPGLLTFIALWIGCIRKGAQVFRLENSLSVKIASLSIVGCITGVLLVNNTSPQVLTFESVLFLAIFSAYLSNKTPKTDAVASLS